MADTDTAAAGNGYDPEIVQHLVGRIDSLHDDLATERGEYMQRCRQIRGEIKDVLQAAKDEDGIPKKALKFLVKKRQMLAKIEDIEAGLEPEDGTAFQSLELALGDYGSTGLGQAAKMAAEMKADERKRGPRWRSSAFISAAIFAAWPRPVLP